MTEPQRLFLTQARADFVVFELLREQPGLPACHPLHYLQMATELLGKARAWAYGPNTRSHQAFVGLMRGLITNRQAQNQLGYADKTEHWEQLIRASIPLVERIESLAPALTPDGPNAEYPWPCANPVACAGRAHVHDLAGFAIHPPRAAVPPAP